MANKRFAVTGVRGTVFCPNCGFDCDEAILCPNCRQDLSKVREFLDNELLGYFQTIEDAEDNRILSAAPVDDLVLDDILEDIDHYLRENPENSSGRDTEQIAALRNCCPKCRARNYRMEFGSIDVTPNLSYNGSTI